MFLTFSLLCCEKFSFGVRHFFFGVRHILFFFFFLPWYIAFCREPFSFPVRLFLSSWEFLFWCETFSFGVRMFLLEITLPKVKISGHHTRRIYSLCLALWGRPFYSLEYKDNLEKRKNYRGKLFRVSKTFLSVH